MNKYSYKYTFNNNNSKIKYINFIKRIFRNSFNLNKFIIFLLMFKTLLVKVKLLSAFKLLIISLMLIQNKSNHSAITDTTNHKLAEIKYEFQSFLKKYKSNSCIMQVFSNFKHDCDEMTDDLNSRLSMELTLCLYNSMNKKIPADCHSRNSTNCLQYLEGDAWTTYITFSHHIDNLCFYYKTLIWEKSSEFLFTKLLNASVGVLTEISQSSKIAQEMLTTHERLSSQMESNFVETLDSFRNFNQFFENYTRSEEILKENIAALETKINSSNDKMNSIAKYVDEKIQYLYYFSEFFIDKERNSNSLYFFFILICLCFIFTSFKSTKKLRSFFIFFVLGFLLFEKFALNSLCECYCGSSQFLINFGVVCCYVIFYIFRFIFSISLIIIFLVKCYKYHQSQNEKKNKQYHLLSDYKSYLNLTPVWMKKYFSKIKFQNEELIGKFKKMNKMIAEEKLLFLNNNNGENCSLVEDFFPKKNSLNL